MQEKLEENSLVLSRGTSILGEVRNVEKKGLLSSFYVVNLMIF